MAAPPVVAKNQNILLLDPLFFRGRREMQAAPAALLRRPAGSGDAAEPSRSPPAPAAVGSKPARAPPKEEVPRKEPTSWSCQNVNLCLDRIQYIIKFPTNSFTRVLESILNFSIRLISRI